MKQLYTNSSNRYLHIMVVFCIVFFTETLFSQTISLQDYSVSNFGFVENTKTKENTFQLNISTTGNNITIDNFNIAGADASEFSHNFVANPTGYTDGASTSFQVSFNPTSLGNKNAIIQIDYSGKRLDIYISGKSTEAGVFANIPTLNFGNKAVGSNNSNPIELTFISNTVVSVTNVALIGTNSSEFSHNFTPNASGYNNNEKDNFNINFNPTTAGAKSATLQISHTGNGSPLEIVLSGNAFNNGVTANVTSINFGDLDTGNSKDEFIELIYLDSSNPSKMLNISSITFAGADASDFFHSNNLSPFGYEQGFPIELQVGFSPVTSGNKSATMQINHDGPNSPTEIPLIGTSEVPLIPVLAPIPNLDFGTKDINTTTTKTLTLNNTGNTKLTVSAIAFESISDFTQFSLESGLTFPFEIPQGGSKEITVDFSPIYSFSDQYDRRSAQISITSDDNSETGATSTRPVGFNANIHLPDLAVSTNTLDFGDVLVGESSVKTVTVSNPGLGTLILPKPSKITADPDAIYEVSATTTFPLEIKPGESKQLQITFTPTELGVKTNKIAVQSEDFRPLFWRLAFVDVTGNGIKRTLSTLEEDYGYGEIRKGTTVSKTFSLNAINGADVTISNIEITGVNASSFQLKSTTTATVIPGSTTNIKVDFTDTTLGTKSASLIITSNAENSPQTVNLTGTIINSDLIVSETNVTFDDTVITKTKEVEVTLSNTTGTDAVTISAINITGTDVSSFAVSDITFPTTINKGEETTFKIRFSPTVSGDKSATLEMISNDEKSPQSITVLGKAISPKIKLSQPMFSFDKTIAKKETRVKLLTIGNDGDADLTINSIAFSGTNNADYQVETFTFPLIIKKNENKTIKITFAPQETGNRVANLVLETEVLDNISIPLLGSSVAPIASFSNIDSFGEQAITTENPKKTITITNSGTSDLTISSIEKSGPDKDLFTLSDVTLPLILEKGVSKKIEITFNIPTDIVEVGSKNMALTFTTDDTNNNVVVKDLSAEVISLPNFSIASKILSLQPVIIGESTNTPLTVTNTGTADLIINGYYIYDFGLNKNGMNISGDQFPFIVKPGEQRDLIITSFGVALGEDSRGIGLKTNKTISGFYQSGFVLGQNVNSHVNQFVAVSDSKGPKVEVVSSTIMDDTSLGRESVKEIEIKNTGTSKLELFEVRHDGSDFHVDDRTNTGIHIIDIEPFETKKITVQFRPTGNVGNKLGVIKLRTNIIFFEDGKTKQKIVEIPVSGLAVEPVEVVAGGMVFEADKITESGDWRLLQGNVRAGKLLFSDDVNVNVVTREIETSGEMYMKDVPKVGDFGGDKVVISQGDDIKLTAGPSNPTFNLSPGAKPLNKGLELMEIPFEITKFTIIEDGTQIGGKLTLPEEIFGPDAHITIETLEISASKGVNVIGSAEINPEMKVLGTFTLNNAFIEFDTFTNSFAGGGEIGFKLMKKGVTVAAAIAIKNGGLNSVELEIEVDPGIPIASTGWELSGGNGFIKNIQEPPISIGLGVDIRPITPVETVRLDNMTLEYTFGTSFSASGTIQLFGDDIGKGSVKISNKGVGISVFADVFDVFQGDVKMLVESRKKSENENYLYFESSAKLAVTIPKIKDCSVCGLVNKGLPRKVADVDVFFNNTSMKASLTVLDILKLMVEAKQNKIKFGANLGVFNFSFKEAAKLKLAKGIYVAPLEFENLPENQIRDHLDGQSLILRPNGKQRKGKSKTSTEFTLNQSYENIIVKVEGTTETPSYTITLPNGTALTPVNAKSLGYLQENAEISVEKASYYVLKNTPVGTYKINITGSDTYQVDVFGAEFTGNIDITSINHNQTTKELKINWTDSDVDSDAKVSFFYDTDNNGFDGNAIQTDISEDDATDELTFDTSKLENGTYYVYGSINDGVNQPVVKYATQTFTVQNETKVAIPTLVAELQNDVVKLSWTKINEAEDYYVYIDEEPISKISPSQGVGITTSFDFPNIKPGRTYNFSVTALNATGEESNFSNIETINYVSTNKNNIPEITTTSLPVKNDACSTYSAVINATDPDSDVLTYSLEEAPVGMTISSNGNISWTPNNTQFGKNKVTVKVIDSNGGEDEKSYTITVFNVDEVAPVAPTIADTNSECAVTITEIPTANDACKGIITGTTTDALTFNTQGEHVITWKFDDGNGNIATTTQKVVINDETMPVVPTIADTNSECAVTITEIPTANDACKGIITGTTTDALTYNTQGEHTITWKFDDGNGNIATTTQKVVINDETMPVVPTIADTNSECAVTITEIPTANDACKGIITGTTSDALTYNSQGEHIITWKFDDGNGNIATTTQKVVINDETMPVVPTIADTNSECAVTITEIPTANDACKGVINGTTTDALTFNTQGEHVITWKFDDGNGNIATTTQKVIINDETMPVVPTIADTNSECTVTITEIPTANDACKGVITGTTIDALTYNTQGEHIITWKFDDGNGNIATTTQKVVINDVTKPIVLTKDFEIELDKDGKAFVTTGDIDNGSTDNCGIKSIVLSKTDFTATDVGDNIVTLTVTDTNNNVSSKNATVKVKGSALSIEEDKALEKTISLYPNPASANITIKSNFVKLKKVIFYDVNGKEILTKNINSLFEKINIEKFPNGIYFVKIISENSKSVFKRIIKN
ncbi:choice-of-anchor D domain-containing protein [Polaribacter aestuariivivens]|uniref:Choice-of-anchor D domain-containing protein n=1 Tax=Polaribacter aestuariivivens TaxID=2304626 RepID=A0A5S3N9Z4_9FLAO|nr:choice-of-anchor D domain-containing protein [Polaribacter aestuariivivens]TMM32111.1 choice-of-anchor D domain-containing protein [Polaribacter aestuariivivens]